jgi:hypothetical protein
MVTIEATASAVMGVVSDVRMVIEKDELFSSEFVGCYGNKRDGENK